MVPLANLAPLSDALLALEPDELGVLIVKAVVDWPPTYSLTLKQFLELHVGANSTYPPQQRGEIQEAVREAWAWLEGQGLLLRPANAQSTSDFRALSRRGRRIAEQPLGQRTAPSRTIPKAALHAAIREDVWALYNRGKYETAVFEAMKAVEVAVRSAGGFAASDYGVPMIAQAFHEDNGKLRNASALPAERTAERNLFVGALGLYKNPHSHRNVPLNDPDEAAEIIMLASHLLRIVDARR